MDLSRRELVEWGAIAALSPFGAYKAEKDYEVTDRVERPLGLEGDYEHAVEEMEELDWEAKAVATGHSGLIDAMEAAGLYLGNPNFWPVYENDGTVPDHQGYLEEFSAEEAFRRYVREEPGSTPFSATDLALLLDDKLDIDLIYLREERDEAALVEDGAAVVKAAHEEVLPSSYDFSVTPRVEQPDSEVRGLIDGIADESGDKLRRLNDRYLDDEATLSVYVVEPDPVDRYVELLQLDFEDFDAGFGGDIGAVVFLPSELLPISEEAFKINLVHEIGHAGFDLPHSAVRDDAMTFDSTARATDAGYGLPSRLLVERRALGGLDVERVEQDGTPGIRYEEQPATVPTQQAGEAVTRNVWSYNEDLSDRFGLDMAKFADSHYRRAGQNDVVVFQEYDGMDLNMKVVVHGLIAGVTPRPNTGVGSA